jgi:hypothetical protein
MQCSRTLSRTIALTLLLTAGSGCGTTRMTDTQRTATEQLLISNAVDQAVSQLDFHWLAGKSVYFDPQYLDGTVDRGYVVSCLRQQLLASGCVLQEDRSKAVYIVEARAGCIGTDRHSLLIGVPQMTVPTFLPGQPSQIPEIPVAKKTDEQGAAKLALFAFNRVSGERVWQSGTVEAYSDARDMWVVGLGPFRKGSIAHGTELAGEELPIPHILEDKDPRGHKLSETPPVTSAATWPEPRKATEVAGAADKKPETKAGDVVIKTPPASAPATSAPAVSAQAPKPPVLPNPAPNAGGQAETAPARITMSGLGVPSDGS